MSLIKKLMNSLPQSGTVERIIIRLVKRGPIEEVEEVMIDLNEGVIGDHYSKKEGKRMVTLIQKEHLDSVASILGVDTIDPSLVRRNFVISGINLLSLHQRQFSIGDNVILESTGHCHPCSRMETNLGAGGYNAMRGHGGLTARVIRGGKIKVDDKVKLVVSELSVKNL